MKTWLFKETGDVREPKIDEWYSWGDEVCRLEKDDCYCGGKTSILTLEVLDHDPMEPIRKILKEIDTSTPENGMFFEDRKLALFLMEEAMRKAVEGSK